MNNSPVETVQKVVYGDGLTPNYTLGYQPVHHVAAAIAVDDFLATHPFVLGLLGSGDEQPLQSRFRTSARPFLSRVSGMRS